MIPEHDLQDFVDILGLETDYVETGNRCMPLQHEAVLSGTCNLIDKNRCSSLEVGNRNAHGARLVNRIDLYVVLQCNGRLNKGKPLVQGRFLGESDDNPAVGYREIPGA